jgi:hypothetical protein
VAGVREADADRARGVGATDGGDQIGAVDDLPVGPGGVRRGGGSRNGQEEYRGGDHRAFE